ncbi:PepSY domain-containing protein [Desertibaculum subflavum]|uniref:PepSY domain-containing protein n=1 Tax=Desertibaculum subflavum TaxID=2268458 RepID=UPI0013C49B98
MTAAAILASALIGTAAAAGSLPEAVSVDRNSSMNDIRQALQSAGFTGLSDVKQSGNIIRADAFYAGKPVDIVVDAKTGRVYDETKPVAIDLTRTTTNDEIKSQLTKLGYSNLGEVERHGDVVLVTGRKMGKPVDIFVNADTGRVRNDRTPEVDYIQPGHDMDAAYLKQELQRLGYAGIGEFDRSGDIYWTEASKNGQVVDLRINTRTGAVFHQG